MLRRIIRLATTIGVPLATLYGVEPVLARHLIERAIGPLRALAR